MKKLLFIFAICTIALTVNAQLFVGGSMSLGVQSNRQRGFDDKDKKNNTATSTTNFSFHLGPRVGYCINDKLAVGGDVLLGFDANPIGGQGTSTTVGYQDDKKSKKVTTSTTTFNWGIFPFVRYNFLTFNKFSIGLEGSIGIGGWHTSGKTVYKDPPTGVDKTTKRKWPATIGIQVFNIKPVMAFQVKEHLFIATSLDFLGFHYNIAVQGHKKASGDQQGNGNTTTTIHDFGFNIQRMTEVSIGVVYQF